MASKTYQQTETSTVWTDAASGGDKLLDMGAMTTSHVRMGAYLDLGASPRADWYEVVVKIDQFLGAPGTGRGIHIRMSQSNSTTGFDGQPTFDPTAISQGTMTLNQMYGCTLVGNLRSTSNDPTDVWQCRFVVRLTGRYVAPVVHNNSGTNTSGSGDNHTITLTPIPPERQ